MAVGGAGGEQAVAAAAVPEVTGPMTTREVCGLLADVDLAVVLHEQARRPLAQLDIPRAGTVAVVVGPRVA